MLTLRQSCRNILDHQAFQYYWLDVPYDYGPESATLQGKNVHGGTFMATKKKAKKKKH